MASRYLSGPSRPMAHEAPHYWHLKNDFGRGPDCRGNELRRDFCPICQKTQGAICRSGPAAGPVGKGIFRTSLAQYSEGSIGLGVPLSALISRRSSGIRGTGRHLLHHQPSIYSPLLTPHPRRPLFATLRPFEVQYSADICTSAQNSVRLDQLGPDLRYHPGARSAA